MTIPNVAIRAVRPCTWCIHDGTRILTYPYCRLNIIRWDIVENEYGEPKEVIYHTTPCKYNMRMREFIELIDSGVIP